MRCWSGWVSLSRPTVTDFTCVVKITSSTSITSFCLGGSEWFVTVFFQGEICCCLQFEQILLWLIFFFFLSCEIQSLDLLLPGPNQQCCGHLMQSRFPVMRSLCQHRFAKKKKVMSELLHIQAGICPSAGRQTLCWVFRVIWWRWDCAAKLPSLLIGQYPDPVGANVASNCLRQWHFWNQPFRASWR